MPNTNLSFAKIVATPTSNSWSQAYNAGGLFIVLSLSSQDEIPSKELASLGKTILNTLESEIFVLSEKRLAEISEAVTLSLSELSDEILISLSLVYTRDDVLYAFIVGGGRITLKRQDQIGIILESFATDRSLHSSSGYLESDDLILIQTANFAQTIPAKTIIEAFEYSLPNDIAETLSPHIHGGTEGGASAIILSYKGISRMQEEEPFADSNTSSNYEGELSQPHQLDHSVLPIIHKRPDLSDDIEEDTSSNLLKTLTSFTKSVFLPYLRLNSKKKATLLISIILIIILILSIIFVQINSQSNKDALLFQEIYTSAKKDYDEAEGLLNLNKSLAKNDYESAKKTLNSASGKFKAGYKEAVKLQELSGLVEKRLLEYSNALEITAQEAPLPDAPVLSPFIKNSGVFATAEDDNNVYSIDSKTILKDGKVIVKNTSNWSDVKALGAFSGNLYILDLKKGLLKFVPAGNDYAQSSYFKGDSPDLKQSAGMAIDSSIYILFADGMIQKYTRGVKDSFAVTNLSKPFNKPAAIYTSPDIDHIYVLDSSNNRIVQLDKSGVATKEYSASVLRSATALFISSNEKTGYILADKKVWKLSL